MLVEKKKCVKLQLWAEFYLVKGSPLLTTICSETVWSTTGTEQVVLKHQVVSTPSIHLSSSPHLCPFAALHSSDTGAEIEAWSSADSVSYHGLQASVSSPGLQPASPVSQHKSPAL